ncbi:RNA polymerase III transcription factor TFIIIC protein [Dioscorea alata]|uniref:RNA polymerase III transcription factor TFIIIC protein n=1 Tax=Dioscorea alata TaxID=55571 RepID=A0ACB7V1P6_DIOAL|nr:RNA polymerase III transcription factor TFIIIC protein [Dioscorea alata]
MDPDDLADGVAEEPLAHAVEGEEDGDIEEEAEDDDEEEEEEEYRLEFDVEMDPLGLAQEGVDGGVELYRQFERLEYEALAERKRKALQDHPRGEPVKKPRQDEYLGATMEKINEMMNFGSRKKSRAKRGRRKGSWKKLSPEVTTKIGDATLHYASGDYDKAIPLLEEVVRIAPNLPDARKKALNFHMIAAHLSPKDPALWRKLIACEEKNTGQVRYCLSKAITSDPKDVGLRFDRALLYCELGEYQKAAESYDQIVALYPGNIVARKMAAKMYRECSQLEKAISILEDYVKTYSSEADIGTLTLLIDFLMENNSHVLALHQIEYAAKSVCQFDEELPLHLKAKANFLMDVESMGTENCADMITEIGDSLRELQYFDAALKFYLKLEHTAGEDNGNLHLKIAQCYASKMERGHAISFFYKALSRLENNIDARLTLCSLFLEEGKEDEAIGVLSPPKDLEQISNLDSQAKSWWLNGKIRLQLGKIYHAKDMLKDFVDAIFSCIKETLTIEILNQKVKSKKKLTKSVLVERAKLLDEEQTANVFQGFKPIATASDLVKASRAKKSLQKKAVIREEKKAAALAAGMDWQSDNSEDETPRKSPQQPPLPEFLKNEEHYQLIIDVRTALINLALGHRLRNKHQCIAQGLAFLYNYLRICNDSQDAMYNIARAYQHVGLVTLAVSYYEKVLTTQEKDHPIPRLPYEENFSASDNYHPGFCSLHREAAYNLHLIYKKSGAVDLARQILKRYCNP